MILDILWKFKPPVKMYSYIGMELFQNNTWRFVDALFFCNSAEATHLEKYSIFIINNLYGEKSLEQRVSLFLWNFL